MKSTADFDENLFLNVSNPLLPILRNLTLSLLSEYKIFAICFGESPNKQFFVLIISGITLEIFLCPTKHVERLKV